MIAHVASTQRAVLRVDVDLAATPIEGYVEREDGVAQPFSGWMQLSQAVEEALEAARRRIQKAGKAGEITEGS